VPKRKRPSPEQRDRLLKNNAHRCCVCKRGSVGLHLHHIDGDSSNTVDKNLAVLCVQDHDLHHRPTAYNSTKHTELSEQIIRDLKNSWESFVTEAKQNSPKIIATINAYGSHEQIHAVRLVMQWSDERIGYERVFHLLEGNYEYWAEEIFSEVQEFGDNITIALIDEPLPVEHCPCCGRGFSRTINQGIGLKITSPNWSIDSNCSIYINPNQPSLALLIHLDEELIYKSNLHLCQGKYLHYSGDYYDESIKTKNRPSVRTQATAIIQNVINVWEPSKLFIGTGDHDNPQIIPDLDLPRCWERRNHPFHSPFQRTLADSLGIHSQVDQNEADR
jgi:hypothetical protein